MQETQKNPKHQPWHAAEGKSENILVFKMKLFILLEVIVNFCTLNSVLV